MSTTIWKFPLALLNAQIIVMPEGAEILTVQRQNEQACLWAIVNPERNKEDRLFEIHGTGNPMEDEFGVSRKYIGTFQQPPFVWHVFERIDHN